MPTFAETWQNLAQTQLLSDQTKIRLTTASLRDLLERSYNAGFEQGQETMRQFEEVRAEVDEGVTY